MGLQDSFRLSVFVFNTDMIMKAQNSTTSHGVSRIVWFMCRYWSQESLFEAIWKIQFRLTWSQRHILNEWKL